MVRIHLLLVLVAAGLCWSNPGQANPSSAVHCLMSKGEIGCLEGLDALAFPDNVHSEISVILRTDPLGDSGLVDSGEEAYRAFLALLNAPHTFPESIKPALSEMFRSYVDGTFEQRLNSMRLRAAMVDLAMVYVRLEQDFWKRWTVIDQDLEKRVRKTLPGALGRLAFSDPGCKGNYVGWLLEELVSNAAVLASLGRLEWAQRMLMVAEDFAGLFVPERDLAALLLTNTLSRLLFAGWRDVDQPVKELERQKEQVALNVRALSKVLKFDASKAPDIDPAFSSARGARLFRLVAGKSVPQRLINSLLSLTPFPGRSPEDGAFPLEGGKPAQHSSLADEIALAANLPLGLAPAGETLARFLENEGHTLPLGDAVCLGAGDGAEAFRVAQVAAVKRVVAVDHSRLAVNRMQRLEARVGQVRGASQIVPVLGDAARYSHPPGTATLVVANHLMEYLDDGQRLALLRRAVDWLKPGGVLFLNVHVARGARFDRLLSFKNVSTEKNPIRVRVTISGLVPADPDAVQVQHFYTDDGVREELNVAGLMARRNLEYHQEITETGTGFVEAVITLRKLPDR